MGRQYSVYSAVDVATFEPCTVVEQSHPEMFVVDTVEKIHRRAVYIPSQTPSMAR